MNFKKRLIEELNLSTIQADTLYNEYIEVCEKIAKEYHKKQTNNVIHYIQHDAEIAIPMDEFFDSLGNNITKKEYGHILLKYLVIELKEKFLKEQL